MNRKCENCKYWIDEECHELSPRLIDGDGFAVFPKIKSTGICGDWIPLPMTEEEHKKYTAEKYSIDESLKGW